MLPLVLLTLATTSFAYWTEIDFLNPSGLVSASALSLSIYQLMRWDVGWDNIPNPHTMA